MRVHVVVADGNRQTQGSLPRLNRPSEEAPLGDISPMLKRTAIRFFAVLLAVMASRPAGAVAPGPVRAFVERHCIECHDSEMKKGGLDLTALKFDLESPKEFPMWVKVHDRVDEGEMPPRKKARPEAARIANGRG